MALSARLEWTIFTVVVLIFVGALAGVLGYFYSRPTNLPITESNNTLSGLTLVKAGPVGQTESDGFVRVDSAFDLEDRSNVTYFLTINTTDGTIPSGSGTIDFYFVRELLPVNLTTPNVLVPDVLSAEFPFSLSGDFDPQPWRGGVFVDRADTSAVVAFVPFTLDTLNMDDGNAMSGVGSPGSSEMTMGGSSTTGGGGSQIELFSDIATRRYRIEGTITITYRDDFVNGALVQRPVLVFENIRPPRVPGPFLYLTSRSGSPRNLRDEDLRVLIDGGADDGAFTVGGSFEQKFDMFKDMNPEDFVGGSWIVWCDPFKVYLGGGVITSRPAATRE